MARHHNNTTTITRTTETNSNHHNDDWGSNLAGAKDAVVEKVVDMKDSILPGNKKEQDNRSPSEIKFDEAKEAFKTQTADLNDTKNIVVGGAGAVKDTVVNTTKDIRESMMTEKEEEKKDEGIGAKVVGVKDGIVDKAGDIKDSLLGKKDTRTPSEIKFDEAKEAFKTQTADLNDTKNIVVGGAGAVKDTVVDTTKDIRESMMTEKEEEKKDEGIGAKVAGTKDGVFDWIGHFKDSLLGKKDTRSPSEIKFDEAKEAFKTQTADLNDTKNIVVGGAGAVKDTVTETAESLKETLATTTDGKTSTTED